MIVRDFDPEDIDDDDDDEDEGWGEASDDDSMMPCPHCGASIHEESERCPECERYLSREDAPSRKPWWLVLGVMLCLLMIFWWILHP